MLTYTQQVYHSSELPSVTTTTSSSSANSSGTESVVTDRMFGFLTVASHQHVTLRHTIGYLIHTNYWTLPIMGTNVTAILYLILL